MNSDVIHSLTSIFEAHARQTETGVEFWPARDLQHLLGYAKWENFQLVIGKAKIACEVSGHKVAEHFPDVYKMVEIDSGTRREIADLMLTRYACYLIVRNGDPRKVEITFTRSDLADAGGIPACSRWLSAATPPEQDPHESRTPAGVP